MIIVRFKVRSQPDKSEQVMAAFKDVIAPSRAVDGAVSFDIFHVSSSEPWGA